MPIRATITYTYPPDTLKKTFRPMLKEGLQDQVYQWHKNILPGHYDKSAHAKYNYQQRAPMYIVNKIIKTGQDNDLVFTGLLKRQSLRAVTLSGTSNKATAIFTVPAYFYYQKPGYPNKLDELTAVTQTEAEEMAVNFDLYMQAALDKLNDPVTIAV